VEAFIHALKSESVAPQVTTCRPVRPPRRPQALALVIAQAGRGLPQPFCSPTAWTWALSLFRIAEGWSAQLFPPAPDSAPQRNSDNCPTGRWVNPELRRPGVTLALLWQELPAGQPKGFPVQLVSASTSRAWAGKLGRGACVREHRAGEKLFGRTTPADGVGASTTTPVRSIPDGGLFVAVLGASSTPSAKPPVAETARRLGSTLRCFRLPRRGCRRSCAADNLRKRGEQEPPLRAGHSTPAYAEPGRALRRGRVVPARARKPRDKAKAEVWRAGG